MLSIQCSGKGKATSKVKGGSRSKIAASPATRARQSLRIKQKMAGSPLRYHISSSSSSSSDGDEDEHASRWPRSRGALEIHRSVGNGASLRHKPRSFPEKAQVRTKEKKGRASDSPKEKKTYRNRFGSDSRTRGTRPLRSRNKTATGTRSPTSKRLSASAAANTSRQPDSDSPYISSGDQESGQRRNNAWVSNKSKRVGPRTTKVTAGNGAKKIAASGDTRPALSEGGDDTDGLRDTDSGGDLPRNGDGRIDDGEVIALCRCGATDWKDGERWIRCDGLGCRTLEHFRCVCPRGASGGADDTSDEDLPVTHLCLACKGEKPSAACRKRVRAPGRILIRGDGFSPSKRLAKASPARASAPPSVREDGVGVTVRRSSRVSVLREGARQPRRRKNVVGDEAYQSSSSSDVDAMEEFGVGEDSDDDSYRFDDFIAPEGQVETNQEPGCRCGAVRERDETNHGCSERTGKHWCRACDPTGKKHAKSAGKKKRRKRTGERSCPSSSLLEVERSTSRGHAATARNGRGLDESLIDFHNRLCRAVVSGNAASIDQIFREVEDEENERGLIDSIRLLLAAEVPIERLGGGGGDDGVQPVGITPLMLASGYWTVLTASSNDSSTTAGNMDTNAVPGDSNTAVDVIAAIAGEEYHPADLSAKTKKSAHKGEPEAISPAEGMAGKRFLTSEGTRIRDHTTASDLGSEARLAVINALLARSDDGTVVRAVDSAGRTAVHHAAAVNGAREAALLLQGERGAKMAFATVRF